MNILIQITNNIESYLSNIAISYKRLLFKGNIPDELKKEFEESVLHMADLTDKIRKHLNTVQEPTNTPIQRAPEDFKSEDEK